MERSSPRACDAEAFRCQADFSSSRSASSTRCRSRCAPWEIEKVLELTSIGVCLDTGHLLLGGGDPLRAMREWQARINHLHLKDARRAVVEAIVREAAPVDEIWRRRAFCRLGEGDLDVDGMLDEIRGSYSGWIVVEQDVLPDADGTAAADQRANRAYLAARGF